MDDGVLVLNILDNTANQLLRPIRCGVDRNKLERSNGCHFEGFICLVELEEDLDLRVRRRE